MGDHARFPGTTALLALLACTSPLAACAAGGPAFASAATVKRPLAPSRSEDHYRLAGTAT